MGAGKKKMSFGESLEALRYVPKFFRLIWNTSPALFLANILGRLIKAFIPVAMLWVGKLLIDEVILQRGEELADYDRIWLYLGIEFGLALLSNVLNRVIGLCDGLLGDLYSNRSSVELIEKAAKMDLAQFEDPDFYDKLERARRQTTSRVSLMSMVLTQCQDLLTVVSLAAGLIVFEPWLVVLLVVAIVPSFLNEAYFSRSSYSLSKSWTPERRELDYLRFLGASDVTAKEVKLFGLAGYLKERFAVLSHKYYLANRRLSIRKTIWGSVFYIIGDVAYYGAYVFIIIRTIGGFLTIGELTFLSGSFSRLRGQLQGIFSRFSAISESALYLQDYFSFMELEPKTRIRRDGVAFPKVIEKGFVFHNVSFRYPGSEEWVLRDVSFTLHPSEKIALVGENGAGKTTLVKLLAGLYQPTEGYISLENVDISHYDSAQYRDAIGVIFQDFVRYYFSARDNIAVGKIEYREEKDRIIDAAQNSLASEVIDTFAKGYDQMLGKRFGGGVELSGGQWQKIALGRAYMKDAQLLILDEPTSALDARAEYEAFERFAALTKNKTAVLISHRFSTVRMADRILVLKDGKIIERGTHEELLLMQGLYAELFELQAEGYR
ncbi:MAG: ABC transporter ATP-binding protein/permease [Saprospiraceae bacterium]|nr:ABC transporter ATP-binding protein/permease [Saprospiraceae bacterium]